MSRTTRARVSHRFTASAERVFDAWTDPSLLGRWLFVTSPGGLAQVHVDARENGQYILVDRRGDKDVIHSGAYLVIERPRRLVMTVFVPEYSRFTVRVEVAITPAGEGCVVDLVSEVASDQLAVRDELAQGWREMFEHLDTILPASSTKGASAMAGRKTIEAKVTHHFRASPERVYDAMTDPQKARLWNEAWLKQAGLPGPIVRFEMDVREGGRFFYSDMRDGEEARAWGTFLVLHRPTKIQHTWYVDESEEGEISLVTIIIEPAPDGHGSTVTLYHEMGAEWADYVERTEEGWSKMLYAVDGLLEAEGASPS